MSSRAQPPPAGAPPSQESKARLLSHMNADHKADLAAYLRHYGGLSAQDAADPVLEDMDLARMTIRSASGRHAVPLDPPLESWDQRRERLAAMAMTAREALSTTTDDGVVLRTWAPPAPQDLPMLGLTLFYVSSAVLVFTGGVAPGTTAWRTLETVRFPGGGAMFAWLVRLFLPVVLGLHLGESWWMGWRRLRGLGVRRWSGLWWLWVLSTATEGFPSFLRLDRVLKEEEAARKRAGKGTGRKDQ